MSRGIGGGEKGGEGGGCEGGGGKNINYRLLGYAPSNPHKYDPLIQKSEGMSEIRLISTNS